MGNVHGAESPSTVYAMEYQNVKALLLQMDTASRAVIQTLKSQKHVISKILAEIENDRRRNKNTSVQSDLQALLEAIETGGVLQVQSILQSIYVLDSFIQTAVQNHFTSTISRSLEDSWKQTSVYQEQPDFMKMKSSGDDEVSGRKGTGAGSRVTGLFGGLANMLQTGSGGKSKQLGNAEMTDQIQKMEAEICQLREAEKSYVAKCGEKLETMNQELLTSRGTFEQEICMLQTELEKKDNEIYSLKREIDANNVNLNDMHSELGKMSGIEGELQSKEEEIMEMKNLLETIKDSNDKLEDDLKRQKSSSDFDRKKREKEIQQIRERNSSELRELMNQHNGEKRRFQARIQELQQIKLSLEKSIQRLTEENNNLQSELKKKRALSLQVYFQKPGQLVVGVAQELQQMLRTQCQISANMDLNLFNPDSLADVNPSVPTLILCINASRLGTDVSNALQGLQCSPDVAIVVLHHKAKHALPNQSSDRVLTAPEYKQLGGIFDMAFLSGQGLYPCDMNDKALNGMLDFLRCRKLQTENS